MKVLLFARDGALPGLTGAQGIREWELAQQLHADGLDLWVISKMFPGRLLPFTRRYGMPIVRMPYYPRILRSMLWPQELAFWAKVLSPDIVHFVIPDMVFLDSVSGFTPVLDKLRCPVLSELNFVPHKWAKSTLDVVQVSGDTLCVSTGIQEEVKRHLPQANTFVLPNGIDMERFSTPDQNIVNKAKALLKGRGTEGKRIVLHIGSVDEHRCILQLIEAMKLVCSRQRDVCLLIVGIGEHLQAAEKRVHDLAIQEEVLFLGKVDHSVIPGIMSFAKVGVALSDKETAPFTSPMKLFEYMAAGLPLVTVNAGDMPSYVDSQFACFADPESPPAIASAIEQALQMEQEASIKARRVAQKFSWKEITASIEDRYKMLLV
ncbi:glycosyltransferase family 4 protein [Chloroflexota bacterium]